MLRDMFYILTFFCTTKKPNKNLLFLFCYVYFVSSKENVTEYHQKETWPEYNM